MGNFDKGVNLSELPQRVLRQKARRIREGGDHGKGDLVGFSQLQAPHRGVERSRNSIDNGPAKSGSEDLSVGGFKF